MAKVRFVAETIPTGIWGSMMLSIVDGTEALAEFLKLRAAKQKAEEKKAAEESRPANKYLLQCELSVAYRPRTMKQNNLQWELCSRIGKADHVDPETVHEAVKQIVYPKEEHYGAWVAKDGADLSTVEYAEVIDWLIRECIDRPDPVDIRDLWMLFTEWRYGQEFDPLEGKYGSLEDYREAHPCCEACGTFLLRKDDQGIYRNTGHVSHIISRGAGGPDASWNVFMLCVQHHVSGESAQHVQGWEGLLQIAPHLRRKYDRAQILYAQTTPVSATATPVPEVPEPSKALSDAKATAEIVKKVFRGEIVSAPPEPEPPPTDAKRKMLDKLKSMEDQATQRQTTMYPPRQEKQEELFEEPPADFKKAQYKDEEIY